MAGPREAPRRDGGPAPARPLRRRPGPRRDSGGRGRGRLPRLLEEPRRLDDARAARASGRGERPARADRRHVRGRPRQRHRGPGGAPRRAPCARRVAVRAAGGRGGPRPHGRVLRSGAERRVEGLHGQADPERGQHRHRRLRPRAGHGLRGAPALLAPGHGLPVRVQRRLDGLRRGDARPRARRDVVRRLVEDVHDPRDHDQRGHGARMAARGAEGRGGRRAALRRGLDEPGGGREVRHRPGEHVRLLGLGRRPLLDVVRDRPLDDARDRPRRVPRVPRRRPRDRRALPHRAVRAQPARPHGPSRRSGTRTSSAARRRPSCRTSST